jgi:hypothetical protein
MNSCWGGVVNGVQQMGTCDYLSLVMWIVGFFGFCLILWGFFPFTYIDRIGRSFYSSWKRAGSNYLQKGKPPRLLAHGYRRSNVYNCAANIPFPSCLSSK